VLILNGSFSGNVIYKNTDFKSPAMLMRQMRQEAGNRARQSVVESEEGEDRKIAAEFEADHLDTMFEDDEE
jgi:hypothetical protein